MFFDLFNPDSYLTARDDNDPNGVVGQAGDYQ
jgi:hypothetical protein